MLNLNPTLRYLIPKPVEAQIKVLHPAMVLRIFRNRERREIINPEPRGCRNIKSKLREQVPQPEHFLACGHCCNELCLRGGECNNGLETTRPGNRTCTHLDHIARGRATCVWAASVISIRVGREEL